VDGVLVTVSPNTPCPSCARQLDSVKVWLQQGAESPEALALARDLGLNLVARKCVLMYAPPVRSLHAWHRAFARLFGQL
jgi:predicted CoA-binding protein